jgi:hypothetical protein
MDTLYDLTKRHAGIVIHSGARPIVCHWTDILGLPRWFGNEYHGIGEAIPDARGHYYDDLSEWTAGLHFGTLKVPQRGMVYMIYDTVVICPDEWE